MSNSVGIGSFRYASKKLNAIPKNETIIGMREVANIYKIIKKAEKLEDKKGPNKDDKNKLNASSLVRDIQKDMDNDRAR